MCCKFPLVVLRFKDSRAICSFHDRVITFVGLSFCLFTNFKRQTCGNNLFTHFAILKIYFCGVEWHWKFYIWETQRLSLSPFGVSERFWIIAAHMVPTTLQKKRFSFFKKCWQFFNSTAFLLWWYIYGKSMYLLRQHFDVELVTHIHRFISACCLACLTQCVVTVHYH